jgi:hypothetical protein
VSGVELQVREAMHICGRRPERVNDCIEQAHEAMPYVPSATWLGVLAPWYGTLTDEHRSQRAFIIESALGQIRRLRAAMAKAEIALQWALEADE